MGPEPAKGLLETVGAEARRAILERAGAVRVGRGQTLISRGERSTHVFIVTEGRLQAVLYSTDGREVSLSDITPGEMIGELAAVDGEDRSVTIVASTEARLLAIPVASFKEAVQASREASDWLLRRLVRQVRDLTERVFELSALNVQARLYCELLRMARLASAAGRQEIYPAPTHAELASRIGTHREAVTRAMSDLASERVIRSTRRRLEFLDLAKLELAVVRAGSRGPAGLA